MSRSWQLRLATALGGLVFASIAIYGVTRLRGVTGGQLVSEVMWMALPGVTALAAMLILKPRPDNPIGWLLMIWALGSVVSGVSAIPLANLAEAPESPGFWTLAAVWLDSASWVFLIFPIFHLLLIFPTGRLPSRRWRWLVWLEGGSLVVFLVLLGLGEHLEPESGEWAVANPAGLVDDRFWSDIFPVPWTITLLVLTFGSGASTLFRYRRASTDERQQIKWLLYAVGVFVSVYAFLAVASDWVLAGAFDALLVLSMMAIPAAIAIAVLKFRLYDIDLVISRTLVYAALAIVISGMYVALLVGVGSLLGDNHDTPLPFVATVLIALVFQPLRERLQRLANRVAYGRRATPYEALSDFSRRLSATDESLLDQVVRSLADGTAAQQASVWVRQGDALVRTRTWPDQGRESEDVCHLEVETIPGTDRTAWITHEGERLGALTLRFPRGMQPTPTDDRLVNELASGMGLALQNLMLTRSLQDRIHQLRESRRRIVAVQDETRRRLERDLHDGAQQQLVALKVKLSLARRLAAVSDAPRVSEVLEGLNSEAEDAIQSMRALARGIYPPLLEAEGIGPAVAALARQSSLTVSVDSAGIARYPGQVEATVYFCVAEALHQLSQYARSGSAHVRIREEGDQLVFELHHDRALPTGDVRSNGFVGLADRLDAMMGRLTVDRSDGGVTLTGRIPVPARVEP